MCAVLAGARSFPAIAEWAADADTQTLARQGVTGAVPSESTFRRTLQRLDAGAFDGLAGRWAQSRTAPLCRRHHSAKQAHGWRLEQPCPGVLTWITPSGRTYTTRATVYPA